MTFRGVILFELQSATWQDGNVPHLGLFTIQYMCINTWVAPKEPTSVLHTSKVSYLPVSHLPSTLLFLWVCCCCFGIASPSCYKTLNPWKREAIFNHNRHVIKNSPCIHGKTVDYQSGSPCRTETQTAPSFFPGVCMGRLNYGEID